MHELAVVAEVQTIDPAPQAVHETTVATVAQKYPLAQVKIAVAEQVAAPVEHAVQTPLVGPENPAAQVVAVAAAEHAVAPFPHATHVVPEVKNPIVEHPEIQAAVVLVHAVHNPETKTYPAVHDAATGALQVRVFG